MRNNYYSYCSLARTTSNRRLYPTLQPREGFLVICSLAFSLTPIWNTSNHNFKTNTCIQSAIGRKVWSEPCCGLLSLKSQSAPLHSSITDLNRSSVPKGRRGFFQKSGGIIQKDQRIHSRRHWLIEGEGELTRDHPPPRTALIIRLLILKAERSPENNLVAAPGTVIKSTSKLRCVTTLAYLTNHPLLQPPYLSDSYWHFS